MQSVARSSSRTGGELEPGNSQHQENGENGEIAQEDTEDELGSN
jgi:hypothetical protein